MISIIIVTYHSETTIEACLASIRDLAAGACETIVVDNSDNELTAGRVNEFRAKNPGFSLTMVRPLENLGFGRGCNFGVRQAGGDFLFFLNPDTRLDNDAPGLLRRFLETHPRAEVAGPMIVDEVGRITKTCRNLPDWHRILADASGLDRLLGVYRLLRFDHRTPRRVDQVIGAGFFMRRETFDRLGGFDERFFMYFEEVDFCKRVLDSGGEVWFRPEARIVHIAGVSTENVAAAARMVFALRKSRGQYFEKHFGRNRRRILTGINRLEGAVKWMAFSFLHLCRRKPVYREKAKGYRRVASC